MKPLHEKHEKEEESMGEKEAVKEMPKEEAPVAEAREEIPPAENWKEKYLYLLAELKNYQENQKRNAVIERTLLEMSVYSQVVDILGELDQAVATLDTAKITPFEQGILHLQKKIGNMLSQHGLKPIMPKEGEEVDEACHEVLSSIPTQKEEQVGKVVQVAQQGYKLRGKVLRPAKILIGSNDAS